MVTLEPSTPGVTALGAHLVYRVWGHRDLTPGDLSPKGQDLYAESFDRLLEIHPTDEAFEEWLSSQGPVTVGRPPVCLTGDEAAALFGDIAHEVDLAAPAAPLFAVQAFDAERGVA